MPRRPRLFGTDTAPAVKVGDRVDCLFRDCLCEVTSWSDAPIPWPRVQPQSAQRVRACGSMRISRYSCSATVQENLAILFDGISLLADGSPKNRVQWRKQEE